jgi:hypothetical protein
MTNLQDMFDNASPNQMVKHSAESRAKMSAGKKGKTIDAETRAKLSAIHKNKTTSVETRDKMSRAHKGKTISDQHRANMVVAHSRPFQTPAGIFSSRAEAQKYHVGISLEYRQKKFPDQYFYIKDTK